MATSLVDQRFERPCTGPTTDMGECATGGASTKVLNIGGAPGKRYDVYVRVRGVVETKTYTGGSASPDDSHLYVGGTPASDDWNVFSLEVSSPAKKLYLNNGTSGEYVCTIIDYTTVLRVNAGATLTLTADPVDSMALAVKNRDSGGEPLVINALDAQPLRRAVRALRGGSDRPRALSRPSFDRALHARWSGLSRAAPRGSRLRRHVVRRELRSACGASRRPWSQPAAAP